MSRKPSGGKIKISERLRSIIPPLDSEQLRMLEQSLLDEGRAYNPLWVWDGWLVDGHHRYEICEANGLPYDVLSVYETAKTIEEVEYRMKRDAIGQRNLPPAVQSRFRAEMVLYHISQGKGKQEAVAIVAQESSVSERQVYRDVDLADVVASIDESARPATDNMSVAAIKKLASLPKAKQKEAAERAGGDGKKLAQEIRQESISQEGTEEPELKGPLQCIPWFKDQLKLVNELKRNLNQAEESPGLDLLLSRRMAILREIEHIKGGYMAAMPHAICPRCKGKCCAQCGNMGWVNKQRFDELGGK
jgi:ParB-like chromosome segregation protein Spo0J